MAQSSAGSGPAPLSRDASPGRRYHGVEEPSLEGYHILPSVRGDLLMKLGRLDEATAEFERAACLTLNTRERTLLLERASACTPAT